MGASISICGGDKDTNIIQLWGDYFDASTRTILAILKITAVELKFT